jgi:hypothetical protein
MPVPVIPYEDYDNFVAAASKFAYTVFPQY